MKNQDRKKIDTKGKHLSRDTQERVIEFVNSHMGLLVLFAKEQAGRYGLPIQFTDGRPIGWIADLIGSGIYGVCRGALAWQEKNNEGIKTTNLDGELRQSARVRIKHMAFKISKTGFVD